MSGKGFKSKANVSPSAPQRLLISPERVKTIRSIVCVDLPKVLCKKDALKHHFSQFGRITRSSLSAAKATATVYFEEHEMAAKAKKYGTRGMPDTFKIFWSQPVTRRNSTSTRRVVRTAVAAAALAAVSSVSATRPGTSNAPAGSSVGPPRTGISNVATVRETDPEVAEELRSMSEATTSTYFASHRNQPLKQSRMERYIGERRAPETAAPVQQTSHSNSRAVSSSLQVPQSPHPKASTPPPPRTVVPPAATNASTATLLEILRRPAFSTEERLAALEARDKLLRLRGLRGQQVAGLKAATVGTCEDMCPEKERYLREDRHQVSFYEQIQASGKISHALAVKQYSRSSADQELPLPHELRPPNVLRTTMNHLLARIVPRIDREEESIGDWYFFLWDRTRAIRKDITQQELNDPNAITLVEQCARFHVACSARLAGQELAIFDPKINTENLTKCLQTLKHMYHDRALRGLSSPNEPEFRAYVALLNLNSGDAMREVQELSPDVRLSPPVRLAVQIYLALSNRNYVRFFRVVRSAGFLVAAILMRYFPQVRAQALEMLVRALCPSQRGTVLFPLPELMRQLGFESCEDAADFCEHCGLGTSGGSVELSRGSFQLPTPLPSVRRALELVENQLSTSLAEAIAGCTIDQISAPPPEPVSSFDLVTGLLTAKARLLFDFPTSTLGSTMQTPAPVPSPAPVPIIDYAHTSLVATEAAQRLFVEVTNTLTQEVAADSVQDWRTAVVARSVANACLLPTISQLVREMCQQELAIAINEKRARQQALEVQRQNELKRQQHIEAMAQQVVEQILCTVMYDESYQVVEQCIMHMRTMAQHAGNAQKYLVKLVTDSELRNVAAQEFQEAQARRNKEVSELTHRLLMCRARRVLLRWRDKAQRARRHWERVTNFPPAARSQLNSAQQVKELGSRLPQPKAYPGPMNLRTSRTHKDIALQSVPLVDVNSVSLNIWRGPHSKMPAFLLPGVKAGPVCWNVAISLPAEPTSLYHWAQDCLVAPLDQQGVHVCHNNTLLRFVVTVGVTSQLRAPQAVLLIVMDEAEAALRLRQILHTSDREDPAPVALLMTASQVGRGLGPMLGDALQDLAELGRLHHVRCFALPSEPQDHKQMEVALHWLASRSSGTRLVGAPLSLIIASLLQQAVWHNVVASAFPPSRAILALQTLHKDPDACLRLVNAQLEMLAREIESTPLVCSDRELECLRTECVGLSQHCFSNKYRAYASQAVRQRGVPLLKLPATLSWADVNTAFADVCKHVAASGEPHYADRLFSWVSQQITSLHCASPQDLPWPQLLESVLGEALANLELLDSSGQPLVIAMECWRLVRLATTSHWCPPRALQLIENTDEPTPSQNNLPSLTPRKRKIEDKLDALLAGLAQCRARFSVLNNAVAAAIEP